MIKLMHLLKYSGRVIAGMFLASALLVSAEPGSADALRRALSSLTAHTTGERIVSPDQIEKHASIIQKNISQIGSSSGVIRDALQLSEAYEKRVGPLFMNKATRNGFSRGG